MAAARHLYSACSIKREDWNSAPFTRRTAVPDGDLAFIVLLL